jgi:hypothetical protein
MGETMTFFEVTSDEDAAFLMPGHSERLHLVLFCEPTSPTVDKAKELVGEVDVPDQWALVHIDPQSAPETIRRFGLSDQVGMAAIYDGSMLTVEYECSLDAFRRLLTTAGQQHACLKELG